ncbi:MAG: DNA-3-methyladenine glycosylase 2 family protein [Opitutaceae bacterium]|nr:DNA-3-methyladenine glycosylase 2 family protein [Opitutaceae bacterium]
MRMTNAQMYARLLAGDATYNGRFFTGVLTTGIYCLPACKARKPKPQHVRFFPTYEAARAAGLRACKKCHPDDFAREADPVLESIETLVAELRGNPAGFADAQAVVRRSGFGATRVFELFRQHYHTTPADLLLRARLEVAKRKLLTSHATLAEIAYEAGFEALSSFHENFRRLTGLTPAGYRELRTAKLFEIRLPEDFSLPYLRRALSRDQESLTERLTGNVYQCAVQLGAGPAILRLELSPQTIRAEVTADIASGTRSMAPSNPLPHGEQPPLAVAAHALVVGLLGLDQDAAAFVRLVRRLGLTRLVAGRPGLRTCQTPSVFDGLLWSIIGQQINFSFACVLRRRLIERVSTRLADGLYAPPTPAAVAVLGPRDLPSLQFSRQKADYVISTARLIASGKLDLAELRAMSATRAERTLLAIRGLGPWSVNYLMMRSLGFGDCVPLGDTGVTSGLQTLLDLEKRPDLDSTRRLMAAFSPCRSLATTHLWQFNQPLP